MSGDVSETCKIVEVAEALTDEIEAQELPDDFDLAGMGYHQALAHVRHEYTNYDQLLDRLPLCDDFWERNGAEYCEQFSQDWGDGCTLKQQAHDLLKGEARSAAQVVYKTWFAKG